MNRKVINFWKALKGDDLFRHGSIMFAAYLIAGALSYFYQMYIGRTLGPDEFGVFGAIFAIHYIFGIFVQGITISTAKFTSQLVGEKKEVGRFFQGIFKKVSLLGFGVFLGLLVSAHSIAALIKIESSFLILVVALNFLFILPLAVNMGSLQGFERFKLLGGYQVGQNLIKVPCGIILVAAGYGVFGAVGALTIATFLILITSSFSLKSLFFAKAKQKSEYDFDSFYKYFFSSLLFSICFAVPANVDVLFVKIFFAEQEAGLYAATAVLGKVLIFLPLGISAAFFPKVSKAHAANKYTSPLLKKALVYSICPVGILTLAYCFFPSYVIILAFGLHYANAYYLVRWYGLAMFFFSVSIVFLNYYLARMEVKYVYLFICLTSIEIALILTFHTAMIQIVLIVLGINLAFLLLLFSNYLYNHSKACIARELYGS